MARALPGGPGTEHRALRQALEPARSFLVSAALSLLGLTAVTFVIGRSIAVDPALALVGHRASEATHLAARAAMGLDRPIPEQYLLYLAKVVHGDFGTSVITSRPVVADLLSFYGATVGRCPSRSRLPPMTHRDPFTCYLIERGGVWEGLCADLDIAVEGRSMQDTRDRLGQAVRDHLADVMDEAPEHRARLLNRRAPWTVRTGLALRAALQGLKGRGREARFAMPCPV